MPVTIINPFLTTDVEEVQESFTIDVTVEPPPVINDFLLQVNVPIDVATTGITLYMNTMEVQTEVVSRDSLGNPDVLQMIGLAPGGTTDITITDTAGDVPSGLINDPDLSDLRLEMKVANMATVFSSVLVNSVSSLVRNGGWLKETKYWSRFSDGTSTIMGVHSFITQRSDTSCIELSIFVSNAVMDPSGDLGEANPYIEPNFSVNGEVYFDYISLSGLPAGWEVHTLVDRSSMDIANGFIVSALPDSDHNQKINARAGFMRRLVICPNGNTEARDLLERYGYGVASGVNSFYDKGHWFPAKIVVPTMTDDFTEGGGGDPSGMDRAKELSQGWLNQVSGTLVTGGISTPFLPVTARGWCHPGQHGNQDNTGGPFIQAYTGWYLTRVEWVFLDLFLETVMERQPASLFHPDTGICISAKVLADANVVTGHVGKMPYDYSWIPQVYARQDPWMTHASSLGPDNPIRALLPGPSSVDFNGNIVYPFNSPDSGHICPFESELQWWNFPNGGERAPPFDNSHSIRVISIPRPLAWACNDSMHKFQIQNLAAMYDKNWYPFNTGPLVRSNSSEPSYSMVTMLENIVQTPSAGVGGLWRRYAWTMDIMNCAYTLGSDQYRSDNLLWHQYALSCCKEASTSGTYMMRRVTTGSPNPETFYGPSDPTNSSGSLPAGLYQWNQSNYQAMMNHGLYGMYRCVFENIDILRAEKIKEIVLGSASAMHSLYDPDTNSDAPQKYQLPGPLSAATEVHDPLLFWTFEGDGHGPDKDSINCRYHLSYAWLLSGNSFYTDRGKQVVGQGNGDFETAAAAILGGAAGDDFSQNGLQYAFPLVGIFQTTRE